VREIAEIAELRHFDFLAAGGLLRDFEVLRDVRGRCGRSGGLLAALARGFNAMSERRKIAERALAA
jgi:hypothetical protein